jgi:hypothetical protein
MVEGQEKRPDMLDQINNIIDSKEENRNSRRKNGRSRTEREELRESSTSGFNRESSESSFEVMQRESV